MASTNGTVTSRDHVAPSRSLPSKWKVRFRGTLRPLPASDTARVPLAGMTIAPLPKAPRLFTPLTVKTVSVDSTPAISLSTRVYGQLPVGVCLYTGLGVTNGTTRDPAAGRATPTVTVAEEALYDLSPL